MIIPYKVIIAGSRSFDDYALLKRHCDLILVNYDDIEIVSGKQRTTDSKTQYRYGADYWGERYALDKEYPVQPFYADWKKYGKAAGPRRNKQMAQYADMCIIFWDGKSRGSQSMMSEAAGAGIKLIVIEFGSNSTYLGRLAANTPPSERATEHEMIQRKLNLSMILQLDSVLRFGNPNIDL